MNYDVDFFVIGAGSGGVRAARFAAGFGARVAIAESRYLGGTCVNIGCIPKKMLVYAAEFPQQFHESAGYGWNLDVTGFDWKRLCANRDKEIHRLNGIYSNLLTGSGVTVLNGHARILDPNRVEVEGQVYRSRHILIAVGGWPQLPDIPGSEYAITSNQAFHLEQLPERIVIVGGGYIAVEFASIFHGLGVKTTLLYRGELFLRGFDNDLREHLRDELQAKGIDLQFNSDISAIEKEGDGLCAILKDGRRLRTGTVFYATGRRPMTDNLGLENTHIRCNDKGFIEVDGHYRTHEPSIFAIGDVIGRIQLTPVALAEGMAVARQLFRPEEYQAVDYSGIPTAMFSLPNVATVGLTEEQAMNQGKQVKVFESRFRPLKLTLTDVTEKTYMKVVVDADTDRVLGCHMVGSDAGEIIQGLAIAVKAGATKRVFDETIGIHPTAAEEFVTMRTPRQA